MHACVCLLTGRQCTLICGLSPTAPADQLKQAEDMVLPPQTMKDLQDEAAVMSRMRHPNVVAFMGLCTLPPCILTGKHRARAGGKVQGP